MSIRSQSITCKMDRVCMEKLLQKKVSLQTISRPLVMTSLEKTRGQGLHRWLDENDLFTVKNIVPKNECISNS